MINDASKHGVKIRGRSLVISREERKARAGGFGAIARKSGTAETE
jgi:hypothetical protein